MKLENEEIYTRNQIISLINNQEINFIAFAITYLQAIGINATIRELRDKGEKLDGFILIMAHGTTGRNLTNSDFDVAGTSIGIIKYNDNYKGSFSKAIINRINAFYTSSHCTFGKKVYVVFTEPDYLWYDLFAHSYEKKEICFIRIDDGGGSYSNLFIEGVRTELYEHNRGIKEKLKAVEKGTIRYITKDILYRNLKKNGNLIDNRIFMMTNDGQYIPNSHIVPYYIEEFRNAGNRLQDSLLESCDDSVLFNTQCLYENKMTDGNVDIELYSEVIKIVQEMGEKVTLKPHPRELNPGKYEKLGATVIPSNLSQETILANLKRKPKCIISIFSSTLLNAYGLFNIPAISLSRIMLQRDIDSTFKEQLLDFEKQYEKVFMFPDTIEELKRILINVCKEEHEQ